MAQPGPKKTPANLHLLRGNPSKLTRAALLDEVVRPPVAIPDCPAHLIDEAAGSSAQFSGGPRHSSTTVPN